MKKWGLFILGVVFLSLAVAAGIWFRSQPRRVFHQRPYAWDAYYIDEIRFDGAPIATVVKTVNEAVKKASNGGVTNAVILEAGRTTVVKIPSTPEIDVEMDDMIAAFAKHEDELIAIGAGGYDGAPVTASVGGGHSLGCSFSEEVVAMSGFDYEEREDAIHLSRRARNMECRAYRVTPQLEIIMRDQRARKEYLVDAEPIVSAFVKVTELQNWSIWLPTGANSATSDSRFDKVFRYLPDQNVILALATSSEHEAAETRMKEHGCWRD